MLLLLLVFEIDKDLLLTNPTSVIHAAILTFGVAFGMAIFFKAEYFIAMCLFLVAFMLFPVVYSSITWGKDHQGWHDLIAKTVVVEYTR